jgi:phosphocarrier protein FPr
VTALVMARGGATSHAAIIARQLGIPALVAVGDALHAIPDGTQVVVDASAGRLEHAPSAVDVERARTRRERLAGVREANRQHAREAAATRDGRAIEVARTSRRSTTRTPPSTTAPIRSGCCAPS